MADDSFNERRFHFFPVVTDRVIGGAFIAHLLDDSVALSSQKFCKREE
ncbi:hypothetical protein [Bradyrhizobium sp. USDA 4508]